MSYFIDAPQVGVTNPSSVPLDAGEALEALPSLAWYCDSQGALVHANRAWSRATGREIASFPPNGFTELIHPEDRHQTKVRPEDLPARYTYRMRHADGSYRWVKEIIGPWIVPGMTSRGFAVTAVDIHDEIEQERRLDLEVTRQEALNALAQVVLEHRTLETVGREALAILADHLPASQLLLWLGRDGAEEKFQILAHDMPALPPADTEALPAQAMIWTSPEHDFPLPYAIIPSGTKSAMAIPLHAGHPEHGALLVFSRHQAPWNTAAKTYAQSVVGLLFIAQAQERNRQERERVSSHAQVAQKMEAVGLVAGGIAHDFNNMLTAIRCCGELLRDDLTEPGHISQVDDILHAATGASHLVRQLLSFSRREVNQPEPLNLVELLDSLRGFLRSLLSEHIRLELRLPETSPWVCIDPREFEQVLFNLCLNARDAMPTEGSLIITLREAPPHRVLLDVSDTGHGIAPEVQARLFTPFFTTKAKGRGTGLGLATCLTIVEAAGGQLTHASTVGVGTTFTVDLPAWSSPSTKPQEEAPSEKSGTTGHILLIEDDDLVRMVAERLAKSLGHQVTSLGNGAEALAYAEQHGLDAFDVLVTDVVMPGINGHELAERLRPLKPGLPTVYMSGFIDDPRTLRAIAEPGVHFLQKPFSAKDFKRKLSEVLSR
jgi:two-component system, cell cycle sensor histidine kinase and response regulator CckA